MPSGKKTYKDMEKFRIVRNIHRRKNYEQTANYQRRPWDKQEDEKVLNHAISDRELSSQIERSVESIQIRRSRLKKIGKKK